MVQHLRARLGALSQLDPLGQAGVGGARRA
jgi:hypothetical protein